MPRVEQAAYDSMRIYLLAVSSIPYLLLNEKKPVLLLLGILPTLMSVVLFDWALSQFGISINQKGDVTEESTLVGLRTFIAYCIMSVSSFIFQAIITYNDKLNKHILSELKLKSDEIKLQNEKLIQSQERLNQINQHLEELVLKKTASIKAQNEKILHYAYSNAHHVRGPVARLLGLIELSKMETDLNYPWFFEKVEYTAKEVDSIIKGISKELNEIDQPTPAANTKDDKAVSR